MARTVSKAVALLAAGGVAGLLLALPGVAQNVAQPEYHPSLGDLMTMAVQPRHAKLGLAGRAHNWEYAAYETSELKNAFARIGKTIPTYRSADLSALFASGINSDIDAVADAVKAQDSRRFDVAYARVTASCNACHRSMLHAFVVIKNPLATEFPNQDLRPPPSH